MRVSIVGSGPSGFYAAMALLEQRDYDVSVDMYDRLPTPWGLVRAGVAPDHPMTKQVTKLFQWCSARPNFKFYLNVEIGRDLSHEELTEHYHAVLYSCGGSASRSLGLPGEDLPGSYGASEFVGWYNGHPDFADSQFDLSGERAVIIGNGNVALDIARILVKNADDLKSTDIADHAIAALSRSNIREVVILGRRGVADGAFTSPEFLALGSLDKIDVVVDRESVNDELSLALSEAKNPESLEAFKSALKLEIATEYSQRELRNSSKRIVFKFLRSPTEILGDQKVESIRVVRNHLEQQPDGSTKAIASNEFESIKTGLILRSVGYMGASIPGVPYDQKRGVIPNDNGRTLVDGKPEFGVYCAGWIKRGASGVIGTNKHCARKTVDAMLADFAGGKLSASATGGEIDQLLLQRDVPVVDYNAWRRINAHECELGEADQRPRVKMVSVEDMLCVAKPNKRLMPKSKTAQVRRPDTLPEENK